MDCNYFITLPDNGMSRVTETNKVLVTCHVCHGKGVIEKVLAPSAGLLTTDVSASRKSFTNNEAGEPLRLPPLMCSSGNEMALMNVDSDCQDDSSYLSPPEGHNQSRRSQSAFDSTHSHQTPGQLPNVEHKPKSVSSKQSLLQDEEVLSSDSELLPSPKRIEHPQDALRNALSYIQKNNWNQVMQGIEDIVQISRFEPDLVENSMAIINRALCALLRCLRSHVVRMACQASRELFRTMQCTQRPEFDEIVSCLLHKTADMNRFIRQDANEALDVMVTFIPTFHSVRVLVDKGASHKNPLVRSATGRLLTCIAVLAGADVILGPSGNKETRRRILNTMTTLLADGNLETRQYAKQLYRTFMSHEDFESIFHSDVSRNLINRIEKTLILLHYQPPGKSQDNR